MADLLTNPQIVQLRQVLESRNLFTPNNPYDINNPKVTQAINAISKIINPTKSFDLTNTVFGRLVAPNTPIAQIGIEQLGKQFAQRVTQNALTAGLPSINFNNLFDGNPNTKLLTKRVDYRITLNTQDDTVQNIINRAAGTQPILLPYSLSSPIGYTVEDYDSRDNSTLIKFTSKGVQHFFYDAINRNLYKKSDRSFLSTTSSVNFNVIPAGKEWFDRIVFPLNDPINFPTPEFAALDYLNSQITDIQFASNDVSGYEYGSASYQNRLGTSQKNLQEVAQNLPNQPKDKDFDINNDAYGFVNSDVNNQIVWGRDGVTTFEAKFGARAGMLAYTRALMQARGFSNSSINQTNKKWYDKDGNPMYNGSPLTRDIDGTVRTERQFNILDPYNNYNKAIRYDGNKIYGAPDASVVYKSVIPKMHPIFDAEQNQINNRNMMFSIENLAFQLSEEGYLGDQFGTKVPKSEVGPVHRGRLMWFPPYGIQLSESAIAKYDSTTFIGRGEPIYTYSNSERIARLSFKLIIDYPPQIRGQKHGDIAKFFAFGGQFPKSDLSNVDIAALQAENVKLKNENDQITPTKKQNVTPPRSADYCAFYYPNDVDSISYTLSINYETGNGLDPGEGLSDTGLNKDFQGKVVDFVTNVLNGSNPDDLKLVKLTFVGSASKLYVQKKKQFVYNFDLSNRRVQSLYNYIQGAFTSVHGKTMEDAGISIEFKPNGSVNGTDAGSLPQNINNADVKPERNAKVQYTYAGNTQVIDVPLTPSQIATRAANQQKIDANTKLIADATNFQNNDGLFRLKLKTDKEFTGFEAMEKRILSPVFHSQTPEDFHRRLTFLQQCTRQGNSTINQSTSQNGVAVSRNSVFGRPPICILRIGDFFHSKVVIDSIDFDYADSPWDVNPEGMGMQFMIANIDITMRVIGGQSLKAAIDVIQNAESFNYYANSTYYPTYDVYKTAAQVESQQTINDALDRIQMDKLTSSYTAPNNGDTTANTI